MTCLRRLALAASAVLSFLFVFGPSNAVVGHPHHPQLGRTSWDHHPPELQPAGLSRCGTKSPPTQQRINQHQLDQARLYHMQANAQKVFGNGHGDRRALFQSRGLHGGGLDSAARTPRADVRFLQEYTETCEELCTQCIEIPVNFHLMLLPVVDSDGTSGSVIPWPSEVVEQYFNDPSSVSASDFGSQSTIEDMLQAQEEVLNLGFAKTPFRFKLSSQITGSVDETWVLYAEDVQRDMAASVGVSDFAVLNVYLGYSLGSQNSTESGTLAFASFPSFQANATSQYADSEIQLFSADGVWMRYDTLPNGGNRGTGAFSLC
jgi:hypothetical protein